MADYERYDMAVLVPSRGRPGNIARLVQAFAETGADEVALLVVAVDEDDPTLPEYRRLFEASPNLLACIGPRQGLTGWTNQLALEAAPHVFAVASLGDDHLPRTRGWAQRFLVQLRALGSGFVYGDDGLQHERLPTAVAVTSDIVEALGWFCLPSLRHLFVDDVWLELGRALGRICYLPDVLLEHVHPYAGKAPMDAVYEESNNVARVAADRAAFEAWRGDRLAGDVARVRAAGIGQ